MASPQDTPSKIRLVDLDKEEEQVLPAAGNNGVEEDDNVSGKVYLKPLEKTRLLFAILERGKTDTNFFCK